MSIAYEITPADSFGPALSLTWVLVLGWLSICLFGFVVWRFMAFRGRSLRAQSIAAKTTVQTLAVGPALLKGKVETDDGLPAVRVEIDQTGTETKGKNSWSHVWKEQNRSVHVRPFRLRVSPEEAVTVVPDEDIRLVDTLETERFEGIYRRRVAQLSAGEEVWVSGTLSQEGAHGPTTAYRSGPTGYLLRGSRMEPLEVAAGGLDKQFTYWRNFYRGFVGFLGVLMLVMHGGLFLHFHVLAATGKVETLPILKTSTYTTKNKNTTTTHYVLHARIPGKDGREIKDNVNYATYGMAVDGRLKQAPFIYSPGAPFFHSVGKYPDLPIVAGIISAILTIFTWVIFYFMRREAKPWYEQSRVAESGAGRLHEKAWDAQIPGKPGKYEPRVAGAAGPLRVKS